MLNFNFIGPAALTGFSLCLTLIVAIGAQNAFLLRQGLLREHVGPVVALCTALDVALMAAGVWGLAALLGDRPGWLAAAGLVGAAVLLAYGLLALRRAWRPQVLQADARGAKRPVGQVLAQALSISLLNPHVYLDTVVLVGAVGARQPLGSQGAFLAGASVASTLWFVVLGYGARALTPWFKRPGSWRVLDGLVGLSMIAIAATLVRTAFQA